MASFPAPTLGSTQLFRWRQGRRVLVQTPYVLPKDGPESVRLDLQHGILKKGLGANMLAPVTRPRRILDVACGTGLWGREVSEQFTRFRITVSVLGIDFDLKPLRIAQAQLGPQGRWPRNFRYQEVDALQGLPFPDGRFNYVHNRLTAPFVPRPRWPSYLDELVRVTARDGWVEWVEAALPECNGAAYSRITQAVRDLSGQRQLISDLEPDFEGWFRATGLVDITYRKVILGTGATAHLAPEILQNTLLAYKALRGPLAELGALCGLETDALLAQIPQEVAEQGITWKVLVAYGRKAGRGQRG